MEPIYDKFQDYSVIEKIVSDTYIPRIFKAHQHFPREFVADVPAEVKKQLDEAGAASLVKPGMRICLTGSSRGIDRQREILKAVAEYLKACGCKPFIIPAMGSHGGATADGQRAILTGYGITEEYCGCPVLSSMETVRIGEFTDDGETTEVRIDRYAYEADAIVPVGRIKPHTAFRGPYESGLTKMLAIGVGKQEGAERLHQGGFGVLKVRMPLYGNFVRTHCNVPFGVATIENAFDKCNKIAVLKNEEIPVREPALLKYAASLMPRILVDSTDVLVVQQSGKNFSGSGMDPNITGTFATPYASGGIKKQRLALLDLADESHGNGMGVGMSDTTTLRYLSKINFLDTYPNALTSTVFQPIKLSMVMRDDKMAIQGAIKTCNRIDFSSPRVVLIRDTLSIEHIYLSEAFLEEARKTPEIEIESECFDVPFNQDNDLMLWRGAASDE